MGFPNQLSKPITQAPAHQLVYKYISQDIEPTRSSLSSLPHINYRWLVFAFLVADVDWSIREEATKVCTMTLRSGLDHPKGTSSIKAITRQQDYKERQFSLTIFFINASGETSS